MLMMVEYVGDDFKQSCGEYGSFEHLLFLLFDSNKVYIFSQCRSDYWFSLLKKSHVKSNQDEKKTEVDLFLCVFFVFMLLFSFMLVQFYTIPE